jgi:hypothetical protein
MPSRYDAALRLDISLEMARKHDIPAQISQADLDELDEHPPAWLAQSRANRTGKKAVWATLDCALCGYTEHERPKKWWPNFTFLVCDDHDVAELPEPAHDAAAREYIYGVGTRFTGVVDSVV